MILVLVPRGFIKDNTLIYHDFYFTQRQTELILHAWGGCEISAGRIIVSNVSASKKQHMQSKFSNICNFLGDIFKARYSVLKHQGCVSYMKHLNFHCSDFLIAG